MAPKVKPSGKPAKAEVPAPTPAATQPAQVKPASDPPPSSSNTCGKVCNQTLPNTGTAKPPEKPRTKADRDRDIAKHDQERKEALKRGDKAGAEAADLKAAQVMDEPKTLGDAASEVGGLVSMILGARGGRGKGVGKPATPATPTKPTTPAVTQKTAPPAKTEPAKANGKDGGISQGKARNEKGKCGEWLAKQDLHNEGYTDVMEVQNKSGHGIDVMGRNAKGDVRVLEVKTTDGATAPALRGAQASMGGEKFTESRLGSAAKGKGHYANSPEARANGIKAQGWLADAAKNGKTPKYEKYNMFIEDPKDGCIKKKATSTPWDKKPATSPKPKRK